MLLSYIISYRSADSIEQKVSSCHCWAPGKDRLSQGGLKMTMLIGAGCMKQIAACVAFTRFERRINSCIYHVHSESDYSTQGVYTEAG